MTVAELIAELSKIEDKEKAVELLVWDSQEQDFIPGTCDIIKENRFGRVEISENQK